MHVNGVSFVLDIDGFLEWWFVCDVEGVFKPMRV